LKIRIQSLFVCASSIALLSACETTSVVSSAKVGAPTRIGDNKDKKGPVHTQAYLSYFLPQSVLTVSIKAEGASAPDKDTPQTTVSVTNTITIDNGKAVTKPAPPPAAASPEPDLKTASCESLRKQFNDLRDKQFKFVAEWPVLSSNLSRNLSQLEDGDLANRARMKEAEKAYTALESRMKEANQRLKEAEIIGKTFNDLCPVTVALDVKVAVEPDTQNPYLLLIPDAATSTDKVKAKISASGLLTSISTTADEKSGDILVESFRSLGVVAGTFSPFNETFGQLYIPEKNLRGTEYTVSSVFKSNSSWTDRFREKAEEILKNKPPEQIPNLGPKLPKYDLRFPIRDIIAAGEDVGGARLAETGYGLLLTCSKLSTMEGQGEVVGTASPGLLVSQPRACEIRVGKLKPNQAPSGKESFEETRTLTATLVDSRAPRIAPLLRTRFVTRTSEYEFVDGQIISADYSKPSSALAFVSLPVSAVSALLSGVTSGLTGRQSAVDAQAKLLQAKAAVYNAEASLIEARSKAKSAADAAEKSASAP
jgi:hypothetical protein